MASKQVSENESTGTTDTLPDPFETSGEDDADYDPKDHKEKRKNIKDYFKLNETCLPSTSVKNNGRPDSRIPKTSILDGKYFQIVNEVIIIGILGYTFL